MKELAKGLGRLFARALALPYWLAFRAGSWFLDGDQAFHGSSQGVSLLPGVLGDYVRREFYRMTIEECSPDCCIGFGTVLSKRGARIGRRVYVGTGCNLGLVTLEDDVLLASNVDVISGPAQHRFEEVGVPIREQGGRVERVTVGADSWIGSRAVVMADIGPGSVIGAGSVVTRSIPAASIAVGTPARVVGTRGSDPGSAEGDAGG